MVGCFPCIGGGSKLSKNKQIDQSGNETTVEQGNVNDQPSVPLEEQRHVNEARMFTYQHLVNATENFLPTNLLGKGGFGKVYRGKFEDSDQFVAIKQSDLDGDQGILEFVNEVMTLDTVDHPNIVKLIGYCAEREHRLLVYEYMALGSLKDHLHGPQAIKKPLDWNTRIGIAAGVASGLEYLHHKMKPAVIYRDLKSSNILLGEGYHAKLSDFGKARVGPLGGKTHVSTQVVGTCGYCDPEYALTGKLMFDSDIYSFGVLLLELISGRKATDSTKSQAEQNLVEWAQPLLRDRKKHDEIADPALKGEYPKRRLLQALSIAGACIYRNTDRRPPMEVVAFVLNYLASLPYG